MLWFFPYAGSYFITDTCDREENGTYTAIPQVKLIYDRDVDRIVGIKLNNPSKLTSINPRGVEECPEDYKKIYEEVMKKELKPEDIPYAINGRIV